MMLGRSNKRQEFYVIRIGYIGMDSPRKFDDQGLYVEKRAAGTFLFSISPIAW